MAMSPLLCRAADRVLPSFTEADLQEQAAVISSSAPYSLRITVS
ncbi:hypothetical protein [Streptomyces cremeus]|uniref:Uncharacterized protein n=1 Tax=Streptomyces cremeus TaxID=66881 RepID=A0ABV5PDZ8_STRCM